MKEVETVGIIEVYFIQFGFIHEVLHAASTLLLFYLMSLSVPTVAPSEVRIVPDNVTSTSFLVTWCPPPVETRYGLITAYILEYGESGSDTPPHVISLSGVSEEYTVTGLKPHTEYHVKVAAENTAGRGPFCEPVPVQTAPDSEYLLPCLNVVFYNIPNALEVFKA